MIQIPKKTYETKRWVFRLSELDLSPFKYSDELGERYEETGEETHSVYHLNTPNIILSEEMENGGRRFALFKNYMEVYRYSKNIRETTGEPSHLYEICPFFMKLHFDIDVNKDDISPAMGDPESIFGGEFRYHHILKPFLIAIMDVFERLFPSEFDEKTLFDNLLVFEAHKNTKISFHIVIDGYYLPCYECWFFFKEVVDDLRSRAEFVSEVADHSVYKKNQSFRLLGSNKRNMGKRAVKEIYSGPSLRIRDREFSRQGMIESSFLGEEIKKELIIPRILPRSILSHTMGCVRITIPRADKIFDLGKPGNKIEDPRNEVSDEELVGIMKAFTISSLSKTSDGKEAFKFGAITKGGIVCLRRQHKNFCKVCEREHENDNPFLTLSSTGDVYYNCRRAQESNRGFRYYIGTALPN